MSRWVKATSGEFIQLSHVVRLDSFFPDPTWSVSALTVTSQTFTVAEGFASQAEADDQIRAWLGSILEA
jgi:hypothetical protein